MQVRRLHQWLGMLIASGHGRKPVVIDKGSFTHPLESDGATFLDVESVAGPEWIHRIDDDGGLAMNKDGTESGFRVVVLRGDGEKSGG